MAWSADNVISG